MGQAVGQLPGEQPMLAGFPSWIRYFPKPAEVAGDRGAIVLFPHAGASAVNYRMLGMALAAGADTFVVQYPQRADRFREAPAETVPGLARDLFDVAPWQTVAPLRLFGHSMGSLVAFEFARIAEERGVEVRELFASAGPAPSSVAGSRPLPTDEAGLLADMADLGGTDNRLLADREFALLLATTLRGDYQAINRYACGEGVRIRADIHALGGRGDDRVSAESLQRWEGHTTGAFTLSFYDGGHFYLNDHVTDLATRLLADG